MSVVRAFAPATVSNVGCGFDIFGFAIDGPGDIVSARRRDQPGVTLERVNGDDGRLPRDAARNSASVAAATLLTAAGRDDIGVALELHKGMALQSGLGSSAASGVAAVVAVDALLDLGLAREALLAAAIEGERAACGAAHADNAAPSLYGGFVLVRKDAAPPVVSLPVPQDLFCALLRPHTTVDTGAARQLLGDRVDLRAAIAQWGNTAALVTALFRADSELLASAVHDAVAEPLRGPLVPGFANVRTAALASGALAAGLSGSGPSIFALCLGEETATNVATAMHTVLGQQAELDGDIVVSPVGAAGARLLAPATE